MPSPSIILDDFGGHVHRRPGETIKSYISAKSGRLSETEVPTTGALYGAILC